MTAAEQDSALFEMFARESDRESMRRIERVTFLPFLLVLNVWAWSKAMVAIGGVL